MSRKSQRKRAKRSKSMQMINQRKEKKRLKSCSLSKTLPRRKEMSRVKAKVLQWLMLKSSVIEACLTKKKMRTVLARKTTSFRQEEKTTSSRDIRSRKSRKARQVNQTTLPNRPKLRWTSPTRRLAHLCPTLKTQQVSLASVAVPPRKPCSSKSSSSESLAYKSASDLKMETRSPTTKRVRAKTPKKHVQVPMLAMKSRWEQGVGSRPKMSAATDAILVTSTSMSR